VLSRGFLREKNKAVNQYPLLGKLRTTTPVAAYLLLMRRKPDQAPNMLYNCQQNELAVIFLNDFLDTLLSVF